MANKTFIPAFKCTVGDWDYYICMMKYAEVARQVGFAYELNGNPELGQLVQRGISARTREITEYLLKSEHRFLGALVVAVWSGEPTYSALQMEDPDGVLKGIDREFGVLTFDGTQSYFVLDGQHRLKAIKDALKENPDLGKEDICVLIVTHYNTVDGRRRTRRLFSNINRNAKQTNQAENIALDEDDGYAVLTRRMLTEHEFLRQPGRVRVILKGGESGELTLAGSSIPKGDKGAFTTMTVLYDLLQYLGWDSPIEMQRRGGRRPSDEMLDEVYKILQGRVDDLMLNCGSARVRLEEAASARDVRAPKGNEGEGHPFLRPLVQKAVAKVASQIVQKRLLAWEELMRRLSELDWRLAAAPWTAVHADGRMIAGKDHATLLADLLHAHLAPASVQSIKRARQDFKALLRQSYDVSEEELAKRIQEPPADTPEAKLPEEEISEKPVIELTVPADEVRQAEEADPDEDNDEGED